MMLRWQRVWWGVTLAALAAGCAHVTPTRDGQLVFAPGAGEGASVLTANGVEYLDRTAHPKPVVRTSASDPWTPATGFLMPPDGVWRYVSSPLSLAVGALNLTLRASDSYVPSWGGEVLVRLDAAVDAAAFPGADATRRPPLRLVVVWASSQPPEAPLIERMLGGLGEGDRVAVVDAFGARVIVPPLPGAERTLVEGALKRRLASKRKGKRDVGAALRQARALLDAKAAAPRPGGGVPFGRVVVVSDGKGLGPAVAEQVAALGRAGAGPLALGASDAVGVEALAPLGAHAFAGPLEV
ncbi:MAG TPA: vWA domain-containing protein, partial [Polyangiaceae bacterium]|nr:vWA domain-containing protein [Polyangiaceae bacterium]